MWLKFEQIPEIRASQQASYASFKEIVGTTAAKSGHTADSKLGKNANTLTI